MSRTARACQSRNFAEAEMGRSRILMVVASVTAVWGAVAPSAACSAGTAARGIWAAASRGQAIEVPGLGALNRGDDVDIPSVSCASAGNCAAGGHYDSHGQHGFVAVEKNGRWGLATREPGPGALNGAVNAVSCAPAGGCTAGGNYDGRGFVVSELSGTWGQAVELPRMSGVSSVSCTSAGNCAAGGFEFVVTEKNGYWGRPIQLPGLSALSLITSIVVVSCGSAGNCAAGGNYTDRADHSHGFVAVEQNGVWHRAIEVPGLRALEQGKSMDAQVLSVSCGSAGSCAAGGDYGTHAFVVSENGGRWGRATQVSGLSALGGQAGVVSLSCSSAGNCLGGGYYGAPYWWGFVVSEKNGVWGRATEVPGLAGLVTGRYAAVSSVSCGSAGNCEVGGDYEDMPQGANGFVAVEKNGVWGEAAKVPGLGSLNKGGEAYVESVSCARTGGCAAGGTYSASDHVGREHVQGFVT